MIFHIAQKAAWDEGRPHGYYSPASLETHGFIHCSTKAQVVQTANAYFRNRRDLVLLCIDEDRLEAPLRYEGPVEPGAQTAREGAAVTSHTADSLFPHIYGALNIAAVVDVADLVPAADGRFELPARFGG